MTNLIQPLDAATHLNPSRVLIVIVLGVHTPGAVLIQPAAFVRGAAETMPENVTVYENSPVTAVQGSGPFHRELSSRKYQSGQTNANQ